MKVIQLFKNENQLIKKASKNNRDAQRHLYEQYSPKMLGVCRQYIKDLQQAEEVMLEAFYKVFLNIENFRFEGSFGGWMRKIMLRECLSFLRKNKKIEFLEENKFEAEVDENISGELEAEEIQAIIDSLPEGYKLVFVMYAIEGYKHSEIASELNITEGTSKSQLFKARKMLQEKLKIKNMAGYGTE